MRSIHIIPKLPNSLLFEAEESVRDKIASALRVGCAGDAVPSGLASQVYTAEPGPLSVDTAGDTAPYEPMERKGLRMGGGRSGAGVTKMLVCVVSEEEEHYIVKTFHSNTGVFTRYLCERQGLLLRASLQRNRPGGLTSPACHACGNASSFRACCCHSS